MVIRVGLEVGVPDDFLAELHFAVDDCRRFSVAAAEVESDPATVEVAADRPGLGVFRRQFSAANHLDRLPVVPNTDHVVVKFAERICPVMFLKPGHEALGTAQVDFPAATLPEQKLHDTLDMPEVVFRKRVIPREDHCSMVENGPVGLLQCDPDIDRRASVACGLLEGAVGQDSRAVGGVEFREEFRFG